MARMLVVTTQKRLKDAEKNDGLSALDNSEGLSALRCVSMLHLFD